MHAQTVDARSLVFQIVDDSFTSSDCAAGWGVLKSGGDLIGPRISEGYFVTLGLCWTVFFSRRMTPLRMRSRSERLSADFISA